MYVQCVPMSHPQTCHSTFVSPSRKPGRLIEFAALVVEVDAIVVAVRSRVAVLWATAQVDTLQNLIVATVHCVTIEVDDFFLEPPLVACGGVGEGWQQSRSRRFGDTPVDEEATQ